jgi:hypothetical protein
MTMSALQGMVEGLPRSLSDQVLGYAESVERVLPEIFRDAGRHFNRNIADQTVFLAGVRKFYSVVASSYWTLDNSATLLKKLNAERIRIGRTDYSHGSAFHQNLSELLEAMEKVLREHGIFQYVNLSPTEMLQMLVTNERQ